MEVLWQRAPRVGASRWELRSSPDDCSTESVAGDYQPTSTMSRGAQSSVVPSPRRVDVGTLPRALN